MQEIPGKLFSIPLAQLLCQIVLNIESKLQLVCMIMYQCSYVTTINVRM